MTKKETGRQNGIGEKNQGRTRRSKRIIIKARRGHTRTKEIYKRNHKDHRRGTANSNPVLRVTGKAPKGWFKRTGGR